MKVIKAVKLTQNQIEKLDKIAASVKEPLTRIKCNIHKGEGICDCCDTKNHEFLYSGFKSAAFYSFCICPLCLYNLMDSK